MSDKPQIEYSLEEREVLLQLAHDSIESALEGQVLSTSAPSKHMGEYRGAFTTLHLDGHLRGCIGFVEPIFPLYRTIYETARAAAFEDPRFLPVTIQELPRLEIEISVISSLNAVKPDEIEVGSHGLMISHDGRRGLLLPQVAIEWGWDRETFLTETCRKAGLPPEAWKNGAKIEAFTADVFGER